MVWKFQCEKEMGQQECEGGITLAEMLLRAQEMLNNSRLDDAEKQLLRLCQQMQEKPDDNTKILIQTLTGGYIYINLQGTGNMKVAFPRKTQPRQHIKAHTNS